MGVQAVLPCSTDIPNVAICAHLAFGAYNAQITMGETVPALYHASSEQSTAVGMAHHVDSVLSAHRLVRPH